jgi:hypothetical protein
MRGLAVSNQSSYILLAPGFQVSDNARPEYPVLITGFQLESGEERVPSK